jgi:signal transduction histidine kinase/ActR/RegA family two-component response regulator
MALVVLGLLLVLTYLLLRGFTPGSALYEQRLRDIDALTLNQAALHRDVLRVSHGLLLNYDPLVAALEKLREVVKELRSAGAPGPLMDRIAEELDRQEALTEDFKSSHALLRNSLAYFAHLSQQLGTPKTESAQAVAVEVGRLANGMFRFVGSSPDDADPAEVYGLLDRLPVVDTPAELRGDILSLRAHGALILTTLPVVNGILARLLATGVSERVHALQDLFIEQHRRAESLAWVFRVLLYLASVLLLIYLGHLYVQLRAKARALTARSEFEHLIAGISAQLIDTPVARTGHGIRLGLEQLGRHAGVDRVYVVLHGADDAMQRESLRWYREGFDAPGGWPDDAQAIGESWTPGGCEQHGCINVPSVQALPESDEKSGLMERGIRSWFCVPLWHAGNRIGLLGLDSVESERRWADDDIALLRTIGEIFANALVREQGERERQALEAQLRHAQRMEALGRLAGGIAHDFNNILGAILGYAEILRDRLRRDSKEWQHVQEVKKAGERARDIVDRILAFSRRTDQRHRPVRMRALLEETAGLLRASLPPTVTLSLRLPDDDAVVLGDPSRLQQVVMNLCTNAAHAMAAQGVIELALDPVVVEAERPLSHGHLTADRYVRLAVRDSGHGMDAATLERLFEPFFTTKAVGMGTGLGLAMVHGIVADHGGAVDVQSKPGVGSSFEVYLRQAEATPVDDNHGDEPLPMGRGETILIVDDEQPLVLLTEEMVAALGYEPVGFESSTQALAAFRANPQRFDLVLADEVMPKMTGTQLAAALHATRPDLPVILMTGYRAAVESSPLGPGIGEILKKPLLSADIARAISRFLRPRQTLATAPSERPS